MLWIGVKLCIMSGIQLLLQKQWQENQFNVVAMISSRAISILGHSPLVGGIELANLEILFGQACMFRGSYEHAEQIFGRARERIRTTPEQKAERFKDTFVTYCAAIAYYLSGAYCIQGKEVDAITVLEETLNQIKHGYGERFPTYQALLMLCLGIANLRLDDLKLAEDNFSECAKLIEFDSSPSAATNSWNRVIGAGLNIQRSLLFSKEDQFEKSLVELNLFLSEWGPYAIRVSPVTTDCLRLIATDYMRHGQLLEAEAALSVAYESCKLRPFALDAKEVVSCFEQILIKTQRQSEISDMKAWLRDCRPMLPKLGNL